jgi:hypothetical protein
MLLCVCARLDQFTHSGAAAARRSCCNQRLLAARVRAYGAHTTWALLQIDPSPCGASHFSAARLSGGGGARMGALAGARVPAGWPRGAQVAARPNDTHGSDAASCARLFGPQVLPDGCCVANRQATTVSWLVLSWERLWMFTHEASVLICAGRRRPEKKLMDKRADERRTKLGRMILRAQDCCFRADGRPLDDVRDRRRSIN